ncbi:MAG: hypothetical protein M1839_003088 [Geoglossum umbratile]|nr:MAG: hypothetical protein M1839_003088 [Geoglossum umbratile]
MDNTQWTWSAEHNRYWRTDREGNTYWHSNNDNASVDETQPRTPAQYVYTQPPAYQQAASPQTSYAQPLQQLQYHSAQSQYHAQQEQFHRLRQQYCGGLPYLPPQYYQGMQNHHAQQIQYHQEQRSLFPSEAQVHQGQIEFNQGQVQRYAQLPPPTPQQQAESHRQLAQYHQTLAQNHQRIIEHYQRQLAPPPAPQPAPQPAPPPTNYTHSNEQSMLPPPRPLYIQATSEIPGERDLDPDYFIQNKPRKFFCIGRVFAVLWTEPTSNPGPGTQYTQVRFNQYVYSDIRRFVVVREGLDSCWCLSVTPLFLVCPTPNTPDRVSRPIHSYSKRGLNKPYINRKAHAIIYTDPTQAKLSGEGLTKKPLQVIPSSPDNKLAQDSLINFSKIYTVEHNIKVKKIGKIAEDCMHLLEAYHAGGDGESSVWKSTPCSIKVRPPANDRER